MSFYTVYLTVQVHAGRGGRRRERRTPLGHSMDVNSTNFWMFFHGPPRIVLKFGTVVEHGKKKTSLIFIFFISHVVSEI